MQVDAMADTAATHTPPPLAPHDNTRAADAADKLKEAMRAKQDQLKEASSPNHKDHLSSFLSCTLDEPPSAADVQLQMPGSSSSSGAGYDGGALRAAASAKAQQQTTASTLQNNNKSETTERLRAAITIGAVSQRERPSVTLDFDPSMYEVSEVELRRNATTGLTESAEPQWRWAAEP